MMDAVDDPLYTLGINPCWVSTFPSYSLLYLHSFQPLDASTHTVMLAWLKWGDRVTKTFSNSFKRKTFLKALIKYATE